MSNLKRTIKKEVKRTFCMFMAAATLASCVEPPVNAAEFTEEMHEEAQTETPVKDVEEEPATVTDSEENNCEAAEAESAALTEVEEEAEETVFAEESLNDYPTGGFTPQPTNIAIGFMPENGTWVIDSNGKLTVGGTGEFRFPQMGSDSIPWFEYRKEIKTAVITRTGATDFSDLFGYCENLTSVDLSKCDTSKAISMFGMFSGCKSLETVDLSNFQTSNVTDMSGMFTACNSLKSINFGQNFNTSNVTNMEAMFYGCWELTEIDLSHFNTSNVTNMDKMFDSCRALTRLDLSHFDTSNVTNMRRMFESCAVTNYDFSHFNTSNVTNMDQMFTGCKAESLDLSQFDMSNVKQADDMIGLYYLMDLKTPRNVKVSVPFTSGTWINDNGTVVSELPKNQSTSIHVKQRPELEAAKHKTEYYAGDKLDLSDLSVELIYSKNGDSANRRAVTDYTTNAAKIDMNTGGTKDLIITCQGQSVTIKLTVIGRTLEASKRNTTYTVGSTLDVSDLIVNIMYANGYSRTISSENYTTNAAQIDMNTAGTKDLIVTCQDMTVTVKLTVEPVKEPEYTYHLRVYKTKTTYHSGETLDLSDLNVDLYGDTWNTANHYFGRITDYTTNANSIDMKTVGTKELIISAKGATETVTITVVPAKTCDKMEFDTVVQTGTELSTNNIYLKVYSPDGTVRTKAYEANFDEIDVSTPGVKKVRVVWKGATDEIDLYVIEAFCDDDIANGRRIDEQSNLYITYKIDKDGNLTVAGHGKCTGSSLIPLWLENRQASSIKTAKIMLRDTEDMKGLFESCHNLESVDFLAFDTSSTTNMAKMFYGCSSLTNLDLSGFDTQNVTDMNSMFYNCESLTSLDFGRFDTRNVTDMQGMFFNCSNLTSLDLGGLDTANVTNMQRMFANCSKLTSLNINGFNTEKITNMASMFFYCTKLTSLNVGSFDTQNVTSMASMFSGCSSLPNLDLGGFDTQNVTNMAYMFKNGSKLTGIDLSSLDTKNVTNMCHMFESCSGLSSLNLSDFDTRNVTNMNSMFYGCSGLSHLDLGGFNTGNVTDMASMFENCNCVKELDVTGFDTRNVTDMQRMFRYCTALTNLDLSSFRTDKVTCMSRMFESCVHLTSLNLTSFDTGNVTKMTDMFLSCEKLTSLDLSSFDMKNVTESTRQIFYCCLNLTALHTPKNTNTMFNLPSGVWYDESGNQVESPLPDMNKSIYITKDQKPTPEEPDAESPKVEESSSVIESPETEEEGASEEYSKVEESPETEESSASKESSKVEESSSVIESSKEEESASIAESSTTGESSTTEESGKTEESSDADRTDLNKIDGKISVIKAKVYDGTAQEPAFKVTVMENRKKITLTEGADYEIEYQNNVLVGTGTIFIKGIGIYKGTLKASFEITPKSVKKLKVVTGSMTTDSNTEPPVYVYDGTQLLRSGTDYKLSYDHSLAQKTAKSAKITITAMGNYKDSRTVSLPVYNTDAAHIINPENVTLQTATMQYTGKQLKPVPTVKIGSTLLGSKDYKVQYQNNTNAGTAYAIVTGKGAYQGKVVVPFTITPLQTSNAVLAIAPISDKTYNRTLQKPSATVKAGKKKLTKNKDYIITYANNLHASADGKKAQVIITGIGNYAGISASAEFTIKPQKISKASVKGTLEDLTVTYGGRKLIKNIHYTIVPDEAGAKNNKVKITITGLGDFAGSTVTKTVKEQ